MYFSLLKWSTLLGLAGLAVSAPVSKRGFDRGHLSKTPPSSGFGIGQYGSFSSFSPQVSDVNILQFALMLEVEAFQHRF